MTTSQQTRFGRLALASCLVLLGVGCGEYIEPDEDRGPGANNPGSSSSQNDATELCSNTCRYDHDGSCDDGGAGADFNVCDYGTDCSDCGARTDSSSTTQPPPGNSASCHGSAWSCMSQFYASTCYMVAGCYWSSDDCWGSATPCYSYTHASSCTGQPGCSWY